MKRGLFGEAREETNSSSMKRFYRMHGWRVLEHTSLAKERKRDVDKKKKRKEKRKKRKKRKKEKVKRQNEDGFFSISLAVISPPVTLFASVLPRETCSQFSPPTPTVREYFARIPKNKLETPLPTGFLLFSGFVERSRRIDSTAPLLNCRAIVRLKVNKEKLTFINMNITFIKVCFSFQDALH